jgi:hypothetical protein
VVKHSVRVMLGDVLRSSFLPAETPLHRLVRGKVSSGMELAFFFCLPLSGPSQACFFNLVLTGFQGAYCPLPTVRGRCVFQIRLALILTVSAPRTSQKGPATGTGSKSL